MRDGCIVDTGPLAEILRGFISAQNRARPNTAGRFTVGGQRENLDPIDPVAWLSAETRRIDPAGRGIPERKITALTRKTPAGEPRTKTVELRVADALVAAIGCPEALHDGTLKVRARPGGSCWCPGSEELARSGQRPPLV